MVSGQWSVGSWRNALRIQVLRGGSWIAALGGWVVPDGAGGGLIRRVG